jgi:hypothetical protein
MSATEKSPQEINPLSVARIEQIEAEVKRWAEKPIEFTFDVSGSHLFSIMELLHSFPRRCVELSAAIRNELAGDRIVSATILGRALIETVAMGALYVHDMNRLIEAKDVDALEKRFLRYYTGIRGQEIQPVHIMDAIRHLEKIDGEYISYLDDKYGVFTQFMATLKDTGLDPGDRSFKDVLSTMKNYDELSEIGHPNGAGTQLLYPAANDDQGMAKRYKSKFRSSSVAAIWQCHHLLRALEKCTDLPERYRAAFMEKATRKV